MEGVGFMWSDSNILRERRPIHPCSRCLASICYHIPMKTWHYLTAALGVLLIIGLAYWQAHSYEIKDGRFISHTLGISFAQPVDVWEISPMGNRIYVHNPSRPATEGQFVEGFKKEESESLEEAIRRV